MNPRPLRFRVWDDNLKQLVYPKTVLIEDGLLRWQWDSSLGDFCKSSASYTQFTGLTDSKGRDIYEGDIMIFKLRLPKFSPANEYTHHEDVDTKTVIEWEPLSARFKGRDLSEFYGGWDFHCGFTSHATIIGNIFESPNLLK
jgi:uncharacterized phage protein (TIGR01671 family)